MTAKDLKNALLQEAVQGKLVPQIASEGNAKDLLEEIKRNHTDLQISTKSAGANSDLRSKSQIRVIKKEVAPITDEEVPFDIPESWCWVRINDIATCELGKTKDAQKNIGKLKDYLCSINIQEDGIDLSKIKQMKFEDDEFERYTVKKNDLLVCEGGDAGRCAIYDKEQPMHYQNALHRIRFFNDINPTFYLYIFQLYKANKILTEASKGVTIQHLTGASLKNLLFPLPPLAEQKRIVAAIEKFMPLIEEYGKKESALNLLNTQIASLTKKAILQEAVQGRLVPQIATEGNAKDLLAEIKKSHTDLQISTKSAGTKSDLRSKSQIRVTKKELPPITQEEIPFDIPESWCWCRLGEIINYKMGKTPPRAESEWWGNKNDIPWISIADMIADGHIFGTKETMSKKAVKEIFNNNISPKGTLIMSFKLTVGRVSILDIDATHNEAIISIFPYVSDSNIMRDYLFNVLPLLSQNGDTKDAIKGKTLNSTSLSNLLIPLPPLAEQKRIVAAIEKLLPLCKKLGQ